MERWENRYTHSNTGAGSVVEHARFDRVKNLAIILLLVAFIGTAIVCVQAVGFRRECGDLFVSRMKTECSSALSLANNLSRSGGSDSAVVLGRIRASIRAVEIICDMEKNLNGTEYVEPQAFTNLYSLIDSYSDKLKNGSSTIQEQTNLVLELTNLQAAIAAL